MKRSVKNVIMLLLIAVLIGASGFTIYKAKNDLMSNTFSMEMPDDSFDPNNMQDGEVPEMPEGETGQMPQGQDGEVPEMPEGETGQMPQGQDGNAPQMPQGQGGNAPGSSTSQNDMEMPEGQEMPDMTDLAEMVDVELTTPYYIALGVEGFLLSALVLYLFMSKFNKLTLAETFALTNTKILYVLSILVLTLALVLAEGYVTNNYVLVFDTSSMEMPSMEQPSNNQMGNQTSSAITYSGVTTISEDTTIESGNYSSSNEDENAILVDGAIEVNLSNINVVKTGDSDGGDNTSFYGINSAIIAINGATLNLDNITVETNATGGNGVFSYGGSATTNNSSSDGTTVNISNSTITTTADNSGGIMTTGGGTTNATNLTVTTSGTSSAAIRSDRGGGTVNVDGGTYTTNGAGSPTIYSTADISVENATLIANQSEGIVVEGANSVEITNCTLEDHNTKLNGQSTTYKNIFLYQSMSGDASNGTASFSATDSKIITNNGDSFYITNTTATINLENNEIINNDADGYFLRAQADSWGNTNSNGGIVTLNMKKQKALGNILIDSISSLEMNMNDSSSFEGIISGEGEISLTMDASSTLTLTGDSYVTSLVDEDTTYSNINFNGYTLYVNGTAING